jgi:hypothetical protein
MHDAIDRRVEGASTMSIKVGIDQGANLKVLRQLQRRGLIQLHQANELEQTWPGVIQQKKGFTLGFSKLGGPDEVATRRSMTLRRSSERTRKPM